MTADIKIQIKGEKESAQEFIESWKQAEKGNIPKEPIQRLYFQDIQALEQAGLVSRTSAQTLSVPWGRILAEISLAA